MSNRREYPLVTSSHAAPRRPARSRQAADVLGRVSDELGRVAGDETLRAVAEMLLQQTRGMNVVSRYDGGLFAVAMVGTSLAGARLYVDRVRYVLSFETFEHGYPVTARFGIANLPQNGVTTGQDFFRHADRRLRSASSPP